MSDDRTSALGLFNYAHSYWMSAAALNDSRLDVTHPDAPVRFLYYHSIELYLKSFLRMQGQSVEEVKRLGHSITRLYRAAKLRGLPDDEEMASVADLIDPDYMNSRYITTGAFTRAADDALWRACCFLHMEIEPTLNERSGLTRIRHIPTAQQDDD